MLVKTINCTFIILVLYIVFEFPPCMSNVPESSEVPNSAEQDPAYTADVKEWEKWVKENAVTAFPPEDNSKEMKKYHEELERIKAGKTEEDITTGDKAKTGLSSEDISPNIS